MAGQQVALTAHELARQWRVSFRPKVAIVLGSGLGTVVSALTTEGSIGYSSIAGFPQATVEGHAGLLTYGHWHNVPVVCLQGRAHLYEGHSANTVVLPIRSLMYLGVDTVIITNASGGIRSDLAPGNLMLIRDHLNLTGTSPLLGPNEQSFGPRFPDMSAAYSPELRKIAHEVAEDAGLQLLEGVYAGVLGPAYETPAEIKMLKSIGADAVGMSTVLEVIAAVHMGAQVLGISCVTNPAAGIKQGPLRHEDVKVEAQAAHKQITTLMDGVFGRLESP
ncbi:MAG: purine-nucleoside phosphorylase [Myxococcales bacterium]|nr:purine-nucleoside phosphorylase [Myxococcales bacterium]